MYLRSGRRSRHNSTDDTLEGLRDLFEMGDHQPEVGRGGRGTRPQRPVPQVPVGMMPGFPAFNHPRFEGTGGRELDKWLRSYYGVARSYGGPGAAGERYALDWVKHYISSDKIFSGIENYMDRAGDTASWQGLVEYLAKFCGIQAPKKKIHLTQKNSQPFYDFLNE